MSYSSEVLADSPVAYWRLGEASGNPQDSAGTNHVTVVGGTPTYSAAGALSDDGNTAVNFDASGDYFTVPDATALDLGNGPFSIESWIKRASIGVTLRIALSKTTQFNVYFTSANKLSFDNDASIIVQESGSTADTGVWHYYVITRSGTGTGNNKVYKDAVDVTSNGAGINGTTASNAVALKIGAYTDNSLPLLGSLDEVAVYNTVLSATRISAHFVAATAGVRRRSRLYPQLLAS